MTKLQGVMLPLFVAASVVPLGCGKSAQAVFHDGSAYPPDAPLGSGGGIVGAGGTSVFGAGGTGGGTIGTGGTVAGTGGATVATGGTPSGTGGRGAGLDAGMEAGPASEVGGGNGGTGGSRDGGFGDAPGIDGLVASSCPSAAPRDGAPCGATLTCFYEDCAGAGRAVASCANGNWVVAVGACKATPCSSGTNSRVCDTGMVCLAIASGVPIAACAPNTCGTGPISCGCLQSCAGVCAVSGTAADGLVVSCNPCPAGGCP